MNDKELIPRNKIIEYVAQNKMVEKSIGLFKNIEQLTNPEHEEDLKDLAQDIYFNLLTLEDNKLYQLFLDDKLNDYIFMMVKNNIQSKNSPYYYTYKKHRQQQIPIEEYEESGESEY